jgi:hypothetical protein
VKRLLPLVFLLSGCAALHRHDPIAAAPPPPATPAACVDVSQIPDEPPMVGSKFNGDARHDLQVLAPNALALRQWGEKLQTLLQGCMAPEATSAPVKSAK